MKKTIYLLLLAGIVPMLFGSCGRLGRTGAITRGDTLYQPGYATGFTVEKVGEGRLLRIVDPWQGADGYTQEVFFAPKGVAPPAEFGGVRLTTPLMKVVCMSSTYVAYIDELGMTDAVAGVSGAKYISNEKIREGFSAGRVRDVGYDANINYELLAAISPDVVFAYGVTGENSTLAAKLSALGIPLVYIGDYVEQSPLGKAEWLVAFGYLFGKEETARAVFARVEERYDFLKTSVAQALGCEVVPEDDGRDAPDQIVGGIVETTDAPVVMLNSPYRDTWFVPGDGSYMVRLIEDAGGVYACAGEDSDESRPISLETAYVKMLSSTVWLNPGQAGMLAEVKMENPRFAATPPVVCGRVYNCNKRRTPEGGSDFWESGAVRPDVVLEDLIKIFHPALAGGGDLYYFKKLE